MHRTLTRRGLLGMAAAGAVAADQRPQPAIPATDFHAHITAAPTLERLFEIARSRGVRLGVVEHAGDPRQHSYRGILANDRDLLAYAAKLEPWPCFKGIQAEGLDWPLCFSKEALARLDYVLTDALTFVDSDGTLVRLWTPAADRFKDKQDFMERYTGFHLKVMEAGPANILANPLFLPQQFQVEADALWTQERMQRIIRAAVKHGVALEINSRYRLPGLTFLRMAKAAGAKFSFGSNSLGEGVGDVGYGQEMAKQLRLTARDLFRPETAAAARI
jgi:histidinol phosphatase-like PHP family hydrolase